jgi:hypothetical protein
MVFRRAVWFCIAHPRQASCRHHVYLEDFEERNHGRTGEATGTCYKCKMVLDLRQLEFAVHFDQKLKPSAVICSPGGGSSSFSQFAMAKESQRAPSHPKPRR